MGLFEKAFGSGGQAGWLDRQMKSACPISITYSREGESDLAIICTAGQAVQFARGAPIRFEVSERDYLIEVEDLTYGTPKDGDRITETINGEDITFEVMQPDNGEPAWRWSTNERTVYRVHCKRVTVIPDTTAPTVVSAIADGSGTTLILAFSERVTSTDLFAGFSLSGTFGVSNATYASGTGTSQVTFSLDREIGSEETVTLDYTPGTVADFSGNSLAAIVDLAVTNNSPADGEWVPAGVSAVKFWPTAGSAYCFTDDAGTIPAGNGDTIANATDRSGNFTALQSAAGDRPTLRVTAGVYDLRCITNDFLTCTGTAMDAVTAFSMFAAATADSLPGNLKTLWGWGSGGELGIIRSTAGGNLEAVCWIGGSSRTITTLTPIPVGSRFVVGLVVDTSLSSDQMKLYLNGVLIGSLTQAGALDPTQSTVRRMLTDAFDSSRGFPGGIYEAVVLNRAPLSANELAAIAAYLAG